MSLCSEQMWVTPAVHCHFGFSSEDLHAAADAVVLHGPTL